MRYQNHDPMGRRQARELTNQILQLCDETINSFTKRCGYRHGSVLYRELQQDVFHALAKSLRIKSLQISFKDTIPDELELNQFDTRNQSVKYKENEERK